MQSLKELKPLIIRNILFKVIWFTCVLKAADLYYPQLYHTWLPIVLSSLVLTGTGVIADLTIVPKAGNVPSLLLGLPAMIGIIWLIGRFFEPSGITLWSAFLLTLCIGPGEYLMHRMVLDYIRTKT